MSARQPIDSDDIARSDGDTGGVLLLYDWFKHMTTLSLVTLGGLLSILQAGQTNVRPGLLEAIVIAIALAGVCGFDGQSRIIRARLANEPIPKMLGWLRRIAVWSYSLGTGMFLTLFVESVG